MQFIQRNEKIDSMMKRNGEELHQTDLRINNNNNNAYNFKKQNTNIQDALKMYDKIKKLRPTCNLFLKLNKLRDYKD